MSKNQNKELKRKGYIYLLGFEWSNPNGDPGFDNDPRIFEGYLYTTDVFLKRRIRDYIDYYVVKGEDEKILKDNSYNYENDKNKRKNFILIKERKENNEVLDLKRTIENFDKKFKFIENNAFKENIFYDIFWDVRVFGATLSVKNIKSSIIGPVQFTFGTSINRVIPFNVSITSTLSSGEDKKQGTIGEKKLVPVAIVEYFGLFNENTGKHTKIDNKDLLLLEEALKNLDKVPTLNTTSKTVTPLLLVEITYKDNKYVYLKGLIKLLNEPKKSLRETKIDLSLLIKTLDKLKEEQIIENYTIYLKNTFEDIFDGLKDKNWEKM